MNDNTNLKATYEQLVKEVSFHNYRYHVLDDPIISDADFDKKYKKLKEIENQNPEWILKDSPTQRAGSMPVTKFNKVDHPSPILSLANAFNEDDLIAWRERILKLDGRVEQSGYVVEPKIDGLTVILHYQEGEFVLGATRGNGEIGEDISQNIRTIKSIPLKIPVEQSKILPPTRLVVRGEVFISIPDFESLE